MGKCTSVESLSGYGVGFEGAHSPGEDDPPTSTECEGEDKADRKSGQSGDQWKMSSTAQS
jgi:hypothetical protein